MTVEEVKTKYGEQIEKVNGAGFDEDSTNTMVKALETKRDGEIRALDAQEKRAKEKLFILHFYKGCPHCDYKYRPTKEEIESYIKTREASNMKL